MEYNLQKTIDSNLGYLFPTHSHLRLTAYPNCDYVNPGIGNTARIHSIYVPIHTNNPYEISKIDQSLEMEGKGEDTSADNESNEFDSLDLNDKKIESSKMIENDNKTENPIEFNEKKRKLLGDGVYNSFQNAKVEIGQVILQKKMKRSGENEKLESVPSKKFKKESKTIAHKFHVTD